MEAEEMGQMAIPCRLVTLCPSFLQLALVDAEFLADRPTLPPVDDWIQPTVGDTSP